MKDRITPEELKNAIRANADLFDMKYIANDTQCGTTMCIAGFTLMLAGYPLHEDHFFFSTGIEEENIEAAKRLLGLLDDYLFFQGQWPKDMQIALKIAKTPQQRAEVGCDAIDHFAKAW